MNALDAQILTILFQNYRGWHNWVWIAMIVASRLSVFSRENWLTLEKILVANGQTERHSRLPTSGFKLDF